MGHNNIRSHIRVPRLATAGMSAATLAVGLGVAAVAAPPGESPASRQDPPDIGTETFTTQTGPRIHDPSDVGTETFTPSRPRIHDPSDIGTGTFMPVPTPTPLPSTPSTTQAPPIAVEPCDSPDNPICRSAGP